VRFEGEFRVPGRPEEVIHRFADVERMSRCMPGAEIEGRDAEGNWLGAMVVALGPKRIRFRGRVAAEADPAALRGSLHGRGNADLRAARIAVRVSYTVRADEAAPTPTSIVSLVSDAELQGVLADFARTGGIPVANALMEEFSRRVAAEFAHDAPPVAAAMPGASSEALGAGPHPAGPPAPPPPATPLQAHGLLWAVVKAKLMQVLAWLGLRRGKEEAR
jgi:carbon monoxide dehydrogenase subunit G